MYAIIQAGGRQVKVTPGGFATLDGTAGEPGAELTLEQVLLVEKDGGEVLAGAPFVANARVIAVVEGETRGPKIRVFKKKRRKGMRRTKGHRAVYTRVRIKDISVGSRARSSPLDRQQWLIKKDKAAHATAATRTRSGSASRRTTATSSPAARSSSGSAAAGSSPGLNAGRGKDDTIFAKIAGRVRFEDHGARGRVISILPARVIGKLANW